MKHQISYIRLALDMKYQTSNVMYTLRIKKMDIEQQVSLVEHWISSIEHRISLIEHRNIVN